MPDNAHDFLVFPVRTDANAASASVSQNASNGFCPTCGAPLSQQSAFCGKCGTQVQGRPQAYQQQQASSPQWQSQVNVQPSTQPHQQPQTAQPIEQSIPQPNYQNLDTGGKNTAKKNDRTTGIVLLGIGAVVFVVWLIIKITNDFEWWEGLIPLTWSTTKTFSYTEWAYVTDWGATILSFISPFILWGAGFLLLCGIVSFLPSLPNTEDKG